MPAIREAQAVGAKSLRQIAAALNGRGIATARGQMGSGDRAEYPQAGRVAGAGASAQETADRWSMRQPDVAAIAVSTRDQLQPWVRTKQAYPGVGVFLLATGGKVLAVIAIERSDIMVGVGTAENGALAVRQ
jgi:hypothetical protein